MECSMFRWKSANGSAQEVSANMLFSRQKQSHVFLAFCHPPIEHRVPARWGFSPVIFCRFRIRDVNERSGVHCNEVLFSSMFHVYNMPQARRYSMFCILWPNSFRNLYHTDGHCAPHFGLAVAVPFRRSSSRHNHYRIITNYRSCTTSPLHSTVSNNLIEVYYYQQKIRLFSSIYFRMVIRVNYGWI